jgi:hypothetical protein
MLMGISIYYSASRERLLSLTERTAIKAAVSQYPVETLIAECAVPEAEFNGEAFCIYQTSEDTEPGVIFEGATKLPTCSEETFWAATQYWCRLLSEVRRVLPNARWSVHVDDHEIAWDEELRVFDPSE